MATLFLVGYLAIAVLLVTYQAGVSTLAYDLNRQLKISSPPVRRTIAWILVSSILWPITLIGLIKRKDG